MPTGFLGVYLLYKIFQDFPYFVQTPSPLSVTFPKLINVMSSLIELLRGNCLFPSCVRVTYYQHSNWQTLLLIIIPILTLIITLWNAITSYEMSPQFLCKKSPVVKASKDMSINTLKKDQVYLSDFWDPRRWVEVSWSMKH